MKNKGKAATGTGQRLWKKAKTLIPGGNQLLSKRSEMFLPEQWPAYYSKAKGAYVWDLDGRKYLDMSIMGIGACMLGYSDPDVNRAVIDAVRRSAMCTLNAPEEVELAELLCKIHPWAHMVRYARSGGESMAIAVRIARAYTDRDTIAFCGYHGWADWYLATNLKAANGLNDHLLPGLEPRGVPKGLVGTIRPFHYNKLEELEKIVKDTNGKLAAIVMEPIHNAMPNKGFLESVRKIADNIGAVLIFDEITIGWKLTYGGSHLLFGVTPDIAVFAKAMSNGHPMAAIIGKKKIMEAAQDTFISSTFWTDRVGPVAALATLKKMKKVHLSERIHEVGMKIQDGWRSAAKKHGLSVEISGITPLSTLSFAPHGDESQALRTLFIQEMLKRGILASTILHAAYVHSDAHIRTYMRAVDKVFLVLAKAIKTKTVRKLLRGPVSHTGFQRLN